LGDIELDGDSRILFAMNLHDRRVHRFSVPDGQPLGSFANGAAAEPWAPNARPFGLGWHDGWLYHGVVDSREDTSLPGSLMARVYRSRADGSQMSDVATVDLGYPRQPRWVPWADGVRPGAESVAQPMFTDIEFRPNGDLILGLRDRLVDSIGVFGWVSPNGDLLRAAADGPDRWAVATGAEHFDDRFEPPFWAQWLAPCDECTTGTLARVPRRDAVVASMRVNSNDSSAALWFDAASGSVHGPMDGFELISGEDLHGGDVESLAQPGATVYLPTTQSDLCAPRPPADITLVVDASTTMLREFAGGQRRLDVAIAAAGRLVDALSMSDASAQAGPRLLSHDQVAVVGFNDDAWLESALTTHRAGAHAALHRLTEGVQEGSRLDLGLRSAQDAAAGDWSRPLARRLAVLLTDGRINRVPPAADGRPETTVLERARALRVAGVELVVVGVGSNEEVYGRLLQELAGHDSRYIVAGDAAALHGAFASLESRFRCLPVP
jgi:Mg-chelatase subunit ChlD